MKEYFSHYSNTDLLVELAKAVSFWSEAGSNNLKEGLPYPVFSYYSLPQSTCSWGCQPVSFVFMFMQPHSMQGWSLSH